jgi:glycopeptide antibiotics resistance protein
VILSYSKWTHLWIGWTVFILMVGVLPLSNFVGHSHWQYIKWVPTQEQLESPLIVLDLFTDVVANILLFVPFGFLYIIRLQGRKGSYATVLLLALILSGGIELYQVYCHNRSTSLLDLIDNVAGALLGMHLALKWSEKEQHGELAVS